MCVAVHFTFSCVTGDVSHTVYTTWRSAFQLFLITVTPYSVWYRYSVYRQISEPVQWNPHHFHPQHHFQQVNIKHEEGGVYIDWCSNGVESKSGEILLTEKLECSTML